MLIEYVKNKKAKTKEEILKRKQENIMINENTQKINGTLKNNSRRDGEIVKNIYETDSTIEEIMEEAENLDDGN